jgi:hypothetical protein
MFIDWVVPDSDLFCVVCWNRINPVTLCGRGIVPVFSEKTNIKVPLDNFIVRFALFFVPFALFFVPFAKFFEPFT